MDPDNEQGTEDTTGEAPAAEQDDTNPDSPDTGDDESTGVASWDDLLATLPEDQRKLVQGEIDRRERDLRKARNEAKNLRSRVLEAEPKARERDEAVEKEKTAEQRATDLADTLKAEAEGLRKRLVTQEIRVQAAAKFADPDDPVGFLDVTDLLGDDLEPDTQAITDALDDLLARKPHLGKPDPRPRPPAPSKSQGTSGNAPPSVESQAAEARARGDHAMAIRLEMQKLGATTIK